MAQKPIFEGTPSQLAGLFRKMPDTKRYRVVEVEEPKVATDPDETTSGVDAKNATAIAYFRRRLKEEATNNPEEIRKAEGELAEFKHNINANREATGERLVYP